MPDQSAYCKRKTMIQVEHTIMENATPCKKSASLSKGSLYQKQKIYPVWAGWKFMKFESNISSSIAPCSVARIFKVLWLWWRWLSLDICTTYLTTILQNRPRRQLIYKTAWAVNCFWRTRRLSRYVASGNFWNLYYRLRISAVIFTFYFIQIWMIFAVKLQTELWQTRKWDTIDPKK